MEEKVLNKKKNGMAMMLLFIALYIAAAILMCMLTIQSLCALFL